MNDTRCRMEALLRQQVAVGHPRVCCEAVAVLALIACLTVAASSAETTVTLDPEPGAMQKPYAPAEGQIVEVTPPPFLWVPVEDGGTYVLQVSRSDSFSGEQTLTFADLKRSAFVPREPLAAGKWYWRYGVVKNEQPVFGRPREFTVPTDARPFPFPDWDQAIQRVPRTRPRLFFVGERLAQVRRWAQKELRTEIDGLVRACEREVGQELVAEPGDRPRGPEFGPWAVNVMRTTRPPMDVMERCALAYLLTGNEQLGQEAKRRLLHFFSWDPEGPTSFFAYDEPPMWMMMRGTRALRLDLRSLFTPGTTRDRGEHEGPRRAVRNRARATSIRKQSLQQPRGATPWLPGGMRDLVHSRMARGKKLAGLRDTAVLYIVSSVGRRRRRMARRARLLERIHEIRSALRGGAA